MNISVVIPNYNGKQLLEKNLPKLVKILEEYTKGQAEIIIADDASDDDSILFLEEFKKNSKSTIPITVITSSKSSNQGFSTNVNRGVKATTGDIILLLNTDIVPNKTFLQPLLQHFSNEKVFAVGCMDKSIEKGKEVLRGRGIGKWQRGFLIHKRGIIDKSNTLWVSCGSGAFRKSIWEKLGGLDEHFNPFYWEDIDLSYRALKSGYQLIFEKESTVTHEHEKGSIRSQFSQFTIKSIAYRNQFLFVWKNITDLSLQFQHIVWLPYHFIKALLRLDGAFFVGFLKASMKLVSITGESFRIQKQFVKKDKELLGNLS